MKRGEKVNDSRMRVTVRRIEKVPSEFYAQMPRMTVKVKQKANISVEDSLLVRHKQLTDALRFRPATESDFSGSFSGRVKGWLGKAKTMMIGGFSAFRAYLVEEAKRLVFSGAASVGVVAVAAVLLVSTCSIGHMAMVNGQPIGVLKNVEDCSRLIEEINQEFAYISEETFQPGEVSFGLRVIPKNDFTDETDFKEKLKATNGNMLPAYAVYAGDEIVFAVPNQEMALSVLENYKKSFTEGKDNVQAEFCENVTVARRFVPKKSLKTVESASEVLSLGRVVMHNLAEGETVNQVAETYGVTVESILQDNYIGDWAYFNDNQLKVYTGEPLLSVKTVEFKTLREEIPFQTIEQEDATKYQGYVTVEQEGSAGARVVEAYITSVNGVETERNVLSEQVLSASVDRVVKKGTKKRPPSVGSGELRMPSSGTLTSRFGSRWGRKHQGIDMSAAVGTNIYAADNGKVIYSQYNDGGFGYMIQIDHGNGIVTYYAHCNELLVPEGTVVAKGDVIATVGNTGRSTGPHLHFEVRVNGTPVDPSRYITMS